MSEFKDTIPCPVCKLEVDPQVEFCPACGYKEPAKPPVDWQRIPLTTKNPQERLNAMTLELARKAAGPTNFRYPPVESVYIFKPGGHVSSRSLLAMLVAGLATSIAGGPLLYLLVYLLGLGVAVLLANNSNCLAISAILLYSVVAVPVGFLIGNAVSHVAIKTQCRNPRTAQVISLVSAVACFISYLVFYTLVLGVGEGFDSLIDFLKLAAYLVAMSIAAWRSARSDIEKTPFCDQSQEYMKAINWGDPVNAGWPIGLESRLLDIFQLSNYKDLAGLPLERIQFYPSRVIATFWYCEKCKANGFINLETILVKRKLENNKETTDQQKRLVYSAQMNHEQISELLAISDKIQLPPKTK